MEFVILGIVLLVSTRLAGFWGGGATNKEVAARLEALEQKCELLEKHCEKLQDQVNAAHIELADERRQLDQKLSALLPGSEISALEESNTATEKAKIPNRVQA